MALNHDARQRNDTGGGARPPKPIGHLNFGILAIGGPPQGALPERYVMKPQGRQKTTCKLVHEALRWLKVILTRPNPRVGRPSHTAHHTSYRTATKRQKS